MKIVSLITISFVVFGCTPSVLAKTATIKMIGTTEGSSLSGKGTLEETPKGLKLMIELSNVPPGKHGFHIHEVGSCLDKGNAAGGHYNPDKVPHGDVMKSGFSQAHPGDLGNIEINSKGKGKLEVTIPGLSLTRGERYNVAGKSVILHEKKDDFGQPTGNAGGRIGCGIILPTE